MIRFLQGAAIALFLVAGAPTASKAAPIEVPQDIVFVFDASGSLGAAGYQTELDFMSFIIQSVTGAPDHALHPTRFGAIRFSDQIDTIHNLTDDQTPSAVEAAIQGAPYTGGTTHTRDALIAAMTMFDNQSDDQNPLSLILITDGAPRPTRTQSVCQDLSIKTQLDSRAIQTTIIGSGAGFDASPITCLVDDTATQIIEIANFSGDDIDFQQGYIVNSMAMPAPGMMAIFAFGIAGIAAARRRG